MSPLKLSCESKYDIIQKKSSLQFNLWWYHQNIIGEVKAGVRPDRSEWLSTLWQSWVGQNREPWQRRPGHTCNAFSFCWMSQLILNIELDAKWISCLSSSSDLTGSCLWVCLQVPVQHPPDILSSNISPSQQASGFSAKQNVSTSMSAGR